MAGRDVVSTDVFTSMGQEAETQARLRAFAGFCLDAGLLALDLLALRIRCGRRCWPGACERRLLKHYDPMGKPPIGS